MTLPSPGRPFGYSCYLSHWQGKSDWTTVSAFTNTLHCWPSLEFGGTPTSWLQKGRAAIEQAVKDHKQVHLCLDVKNFPDQTLAVLKMASKRWAWVNLIELADEPKGWDSSAQVVRVNKLIDSLSLPRKPLGVVLTQKQFPGHTDITSYSWIGLEAYVDPPGASPAENQTALDAYLVPAMKAVPKGKGIVLVGMAYLRNLDRSGQPNWTDPATIGPLLKHTYRTAVADPRVLAMNCFSYLRATGAAEVPLIANAVRAIGRACLSY